MLPFRALGRLIAGLITITSIFVSPQCTADTLPTLAILPIVKKDHYWNWSNKEKVEAEINQTVTEAFFGLKRFKIIEREMLGKVLREGGFQKSGLVDEGTAVAIGKQIGARQVVVGSFSTFSNSRHEQGLGTMYESGINLNIRIVNTETGSVDNVITVEGKSSGISHAESINDAVKMLSKNTQREIGNLFPSLGFVIKLVNDGEALIDLGKSHGVKPGDMFVVYAQGEDIIHPVTGKRIKGERRIVNELKVTAVNDDDLSTAKVVGEKNVLQVGMPLESKKKNGGLSELFDRFK
ncbi:CsgG/HfaB family protein [Paucibacter soli]|uniref:CsgG/HfaB family protein n=1 Tax=Paucibacter soli TaxID=3133433 RepID=UPI00309AACA7